MTKVTRRRFFGLLLTVATSLLLSTVTVTQVAYADAGAALEEEHEAIVMAQEFSDAIAPSENLTASDYVDLRDESGQLIGYIVEYEDAGGAPHGYVVFDNSHESLIAEFCLSEGAVSPFDYAKSEAEDDVLSALTISDNVAVKTAPFTYAAVSTNGTTYDMYGNVGSVDLQSFAAQPASHPWDPVFIDGFNPAYSINAMNNAPGQVISFTESEIEELTGKYGCAVTALLCCAAHYVGPDAFPWISYANDYNYLWNASNTTVYEVSNGISYGSTYNSNIGPALVQYCASKGLSVTQSSTASPTYAQFQTVINRGDMAIFCGGVSDPSSADGRSGHAMAVEGWAKLSLAGQPSDYIYTLMIADGWFLDIRFINFYYTQYLDTYGVFFN